MDRHGRGVGLYSPRPDADGTLPQQALALHGSHFVLYHTQAVLAGLGGERRAAAQVLDEMLAARMAQQRRSSDGGARRSSDSSTAAQAHVPDAALANAAPAPACPVQSPDDYDLAADLAEEPYRCSPCLR